MSPPTPGRALVDTNVLVYAHDRQDTRKRHIALELLDSLASTGQLLLSARVLNEFYVIITRPTRPGALSHDQAAEAVHDIALSAEVLPVFMSSTTLALDGVGRYQMSFWDALIWAVASENGIPLIYTEDTPGRPEIGGIRYVNPFV